MDPYAPINGISLERYAELGADLDGITDEAQQCQKVGELGIAAEDWKAAMAGWTARMQDMSLMGQVATRYMQLYNTALAAKKGVASCSFEDWCNVSGAIQVFGYEAAMNHYGISMGDWTTISAHWQNEISKDPMGMAVHRNQLQEQEAGRLRSGGQPYKVNVSRSAPGAPVAGGAAAFDSNAAMAQGMAGVQAHNQQYVAQAAAVMNDPSVAAAMKMAGAMNMMGGGTGLIVGAKVLVAWSDGNKYPANIRQNNGAQAEVMFPDGRTMWVDTQYLTPG